MSTRFSLLSARPALAAAILAIALAACSGGSDSASGAATQMPAPAASSGAVGDAPAPSEPTTADAGAGSVTLITPGDEPRTELRYDFTDGQQVSAAMSQTQQMAQSIDGQPAPEVMLTTLFDFVGEVEADGDTYTLPLTVENSRVADDTDPQLRDAVSEGISALDGATFVTVGDTRGQIIDSTIEDAEGLQSDPSMMSMMESMAEQSALSFPLPAEPVGVGARWSSTQELDLQGFVIPQTTETELLSIDGNVIELAITSTQEVPPGPMTLGGTEVEIRAWDVQAEGTVLIDLTHPTPTSESRATVHQEMATTIGDQTSVLEQDITTTVELSPN